MPRWTRIARGMFGTGITFAVGVGAVSSLVGVTAMLFGELTLIELAHAASEAELTAPNAIGGKVYRLHLRQNDAEVWLLVRGPYESLQAARAARDELVAQGATPGWPRRVGPLQTEVRQAQP